MSTFSSNSVQSFGGEVSSTGQHLEGLSSGIDARPLESINLPLVGETPTSDDRDQHQVRDELVKRKSNGRKRAASGEEPRARARGVGSLHELAELAKQPMRTLPSTRGEVDIEVHEGEGLNYEKLQNLAERVSRRPADENTPKLARMLCAMAPRVNLPHREAIAAEVTHAAAELGDQVWALQTQGQFSAFGACGRDLLFRFFEKWLVEKWSGEGESGGEENGEAGKTGKARVAKGKLAMIGMSQGGGAGAFGGGKGVGGGHSLVEKRGGGRSEVDVHHGTDPDSGVKVVSAKFGGEADAVKPVSDPVLPGFQSLSRFGNDPLAGAIMALLIAFNDAGEALTRLTDEVQQATDRVKAHRDSMKKLKFGSDKEKEQTKERRAQLELDNLNDARQMLMFRLQVALQQWTQLMGMVTNASKVGHDAHMSVIRNYSK